MKRPVQWSRDALEDFKQQIDYIVADNPSAARRVAERISAAGTALGALATGRPGRVAGTYEKLVTRLPLIIAYAITQTPDGEVISILRVIHGARDWHRDSWPTES